MLCRRAGATVSESKCQQDGQFRFAVLMGAACLLWKGFPYFSITIILADMECNTNQTADTAPTDADLDEQADRARAALFARAVYDRDPESCIEWLRQYAGWSDED
jgi:hypothetical protein